MDLPTLIHASAHKSLAQLADRTPGKLSRAQWGEYRKGDFGQFPRPQTIKAIAAALGVTERAVVLAVGESVGLNVNDDQPLLVSMLPPEVADLDDNAVTTILQYVRLQIEDAQQPAAVRAVRSVTAVPAATFSQQQRVSAGTGGLRLVP